MSPWVGGLLFVYVVTAISSYHESCRASRAVPQYGVSRSVSVILAVLWPVVIPWGVLLRRLLESGIVKPLGLGVEWCFVGYCAVLVAILVAVT